MCHVPGYVHYVLKLFIDYIFSHVHRYHVPDLTSLFDALLKF